MFKVLESIYKNKIVTEDISTTGSDRMRGKIEGTSDVLGACETICPAKAFETDGNQYAIDYKKCLFCGECVRAAQGLSHSHEDVLPEFIAATQVAVAKEITNKLGRSLNVRHVDAGSCNACDFEMGALSNPIYDLHRFGVSFVASPRHADLIMVTGTVTRNLEQALKMTYEAMPEPRLVMACGACAAGGETYGSTYAIVGAVSEVVPVDIYIPGCPPRPSTMIVGLLAAADLLKERMK